MATFERVFLVRRSCKLHSNRTSSAFNSVDSSGTCLFILWRSVLSLRPKLRVPKVSVIRCVTVSMPDWTSGFWEVVHRRRGSVRGTGKWVRRHAATWPDAWTM